MEPARPSMPPIPRSARYGTRSATGAKVSHTRAQVRINGAGAAGAGAGAVQRDGAHPRSRETAPGADARVRELGQSPPPRGGGGGGGEPPAAPPDTIGWEMSHSLVSFDQVLCIA